MKRNLKSLALSVAEGSVPDLLADIVANEYWEKKKGKIKLQFTMAVNIPMHTESADKLSSILVYAPYRDRVKALEDGENLLFNSTQLKSGKEKEQFR